MGRLKACAAAFSFVLLTVPGAGSAAPKGGAPLQDLRAPRVIDGDTIEDAIAGERIRLVNIDAAETGGRARCSAERRLGEQARTAARALLASADAVMLERSGRLDRFGRTLGRIYVDGRDLGDMLVARGLARPWRGRREPWCDADGALVRYAPED